MCRTWEVPGYPDNNTCFLYAHSPYQQLKMEYFNPKTENYTGRGANRHDVNSPPPPPPGPCATQQAVMPVKWPKFSTTNVIIATHASCRCLWFIVLF